MVKKYLLAVAVLFAAPTLAFASVSITSVADQSAEVGTSINLDVVVNRTGGLSFPFTQNDWQSTEIDGTCYNTPNLTSGTGLSTTTYNYSTTSPAGDYVVPVRVFHLNGCDDNLFLAGAPAADETSFNFELTNPPAPSTPSSEPEKKKKSGGVRMGVCYYLNAAGITCTPEMQSNWGSAEYREWAIGEWRKAMCRNHGAFCGK